MANVKYTYLITDFPNDIADAGRLYIEILEGSDITTTVASVSTDVTNCDIWFKGSLSPEDWATLSGIVAVHSGEEYVEEVPVIDQSVYGKRADGTWSPFNLTNDGRLKIDVLSTAGPHGNESHTSEFITVSGVTYEALDANEDVGTGADQVAQGDHLHDDRYYTESEIDAFGFLTTISGGDHTKLTNIGTNSHDDIDTHIADDTIHFPWSDVEDEIATLSGISGYLTFGDQSTLRLPTGLLKTTGGTTLGYVMPTSGVINQIGVITDISNFSSYRILRNGSPVTTLTFSGISSDTEDISISFDKDDILSADYISTVSGSDINNSYSPDDNTLFLAHIDGDEKDLRHITNSSTTCKGMSGRLHGAVFTSISGSFNNCLDFDGIDDFVEIHHHEDYNVQDCTIELRFSTDSVVAGKHCLFSKDYDGSENGNLSFGLDGDEIYVDSEEGKDTHSFTSSSLNININTLYHLAVVLGTGGIKMFLNGTLIHSDAGWDQGLNGTKCVPITLGVSQDEMDEKYFKLDKLQYYYDGKIDELRISNIRRYETGFTPSSTEFTKDSNTVGLWHFNETGGYVTYDSSDTIHNAMSFSTGSIPSPKDDYVKFGTDAMQMNSSLGDWLKFIHNEEYEVLAATVEGWILPHEIDLDGIIFQKGDSSTEGGLQIKWLTANSKLEVTYYGASTSRTITTSNNSFSELDWNHCSVTIDADYLKVFVNSILVGSETLTSDYSNVWTNNKEDVYIAAKDDATLFAQVYFDEFRISDTVRVYDSDLVHEVSVIIGVE